MSCWARRSRCAGDSSATVTADAAWAARSTMQMIAEVFFIRKQRPQSHTDRARLVVKDVVGLVALGLVAVSAVAADWPEFLPPPDTLAPDEVSAVRRAWTEPTLHRRVSGPPAPMPLRSYLALVDSPELVIATNRKSAGVSCSTSLRAAARATCVRRASTCKSSRMSANTRDADA